VTSQVVGAACTGAALPGRLADDVAGPLPSLERQRLPSDVVAVGVLLGDWPIRGSLGSMGTLGGALWELWAGLACHALVLVRSAATGRVAPAVAALPTTRSP
jgi:hypothetical protein